MAKVLVVEDSEVLNTAYKQILEDKGHTVYSALNGKEALELAQNDEPDIIFLDLLMPVMGGIDFLRSYDLRSKHPKVKVVILSNLDSDKDIEEALELGAVKYVLKAHASPLQLSILVDKLSTQNLTK